MGIYFSLQLLVMCRKHLLFPLARKWNKGKLLKLHPGGLKLWKQTAQKQVIRHQLLLIQITVRSWVTPLWGRQTANGCWISGCWSLCSEFTALKAVHYIKWLQHRGDKQVLALKDFCENRHLSTKMFSSWRGKRLKCWDGAWRIWIQHLLQFHTEYLCKSCNHHFLSRNQRPFLSQHWGCGDPQIVSPGCWEPIPRMIDLKNQNQCPEWGNDGRKKGGGVSLLQEFRDLLTLRLMGLRCKGE